jgi:peptide/nickel transport system ATP-binding protein
MTEPGEAVGELEPTISRGVPDSQQAGARLSVRHLSVESVSDGRMVLRDVSFSVGAGETLGLVGESGSGKTTVGLALLGFARRGLRISSGVVDVDGIDMLSLSDDELRERRGAVVAYVPQDPVGALNPALKIGTQLREMFRGRNREGDVEERLAQLLAEVNLPMERVVNTYPHELSGGQQQRVLLAMAFALRPSVVVLDEPTTGLDVTTQHHILDSVRELCATSGTTAVFVSHDLAVIGELVDDVVVMYAGRIVEAGSKRAIFGQPAHPYTRALLRAAPDPNRAGALVGIPGHPPRPDERDADACAFAPRCPHAAPQCVAAQPALIATAGDAAHTARCVRLEEIGRDRASPEGRQSASVQSIAESTALEVVGLTADYGETRVVQHFSVDLDRRECVAILGESGSGKTTIARCISGLHGSFGGEVKLDGVPLPDAARHRSLDQLRALQYVFQNPHASLNPRKTVDEILAQPTRRAFDCEPAETTRRIVDALETVALSADARHRFPGELSGGECQRVAIARALVVEPTVLLCDEVTSALDVSVQASIIETLRRLQETRNVAILFITHNLALVPAIAQRVVVLRDGEIVEAGDSESVLRNPVDAYTKSLVHDVPRMPESTTA